MQSLEAQLSESQARQRELLRGISLKKEELLRNGIRLRNMTDVNELKDAIDDDEVQLLNRFGRQPHPAVQEDIRVIDDTDDEEDEDDDQFQRVHTRSSRHGFTTEYNSEQNSDPTTQYTQQAHNPNVATHELEHDLHMIRQKLIRSQGAQQQNEQMKLDVVSLRSENRQQEKELQRLRAEMQQMKDINSKQNEVVQQITTELTVLRRENERLENSLEVSSSSVKEFEVKEKQMLVQQHEHDVMSVQLHEMEAKNTKLQAQMIELKKSVELITTECQEQKRLFEEEKKLHQEDNAAAEKKLNDFQLIIESQSQERELLSNTVSSQNEGITELTNKYELHMKQTKYVHQLLLNDAKTLDTFLFEPFTTGVNKDSRLSESQLDALTEIPDATERALKPFPKLRKLILLIKKSMLTVLIEQNRLRDKRQEIHKHYMEKKQKVDTLEGMLRENTQALSFVKKELHKIYEDEGSVGKEFSQIAALRPASSWHYNHR